MARFTRRFAWLPALAMIWCWAPAAGAAPVAHEPLGAAWMTSPHLRPDLAPFSRLFKARALRGARFPGAVRLSGLSQAALLDVSVVSAANAWAVGTHCASGCGTSSEVQDTLIMHWNGTAWSKVASPSPGANFNYLYDVSADSASDVWAAGYYCASGCATSPVYDTLILHWNGTRWSKVTSPDPSATFNWLGGVSAVSATDAWAAGYYCASGCGTASEVDDTLILQWNGTAWSHVTSPDPSANLNLLSGVTASSTGAWAVGSYAKNGANDTLILRWNGTTWSQVSSPNLGNSADVLFGVAELSTGTAWAVGGYCAAGCGSLSSTTHTLTMRWNGTRWSIVTSPNLGASTDLNDVTAVSGKNAWAAGYYCVSGCGTSAETDNTVILHWNGTAWSQSPTPNPSTTANYLFGVNAASATDAWAVGTYCASGCGTSSAVDDTLTLRWNGTAWTTS